MMSLQNKNKVYNKNDFDNFIDLVTKMLDYKPK